MGKTLKILCWVIVLGLSLVSSSIAQTERRRIVVFGDSITAGYGVDAEQNFPSLLQEKIDRDGFPYQIINAGVGGDTSAGGLRRIEWVLKQPIDILILELGGNDALRGLPLTDTAKNLRSIIDRARARYPDLKIIIAGMKAPPNLGANYIEEFERLYVDLAKNTKCDLIPFLLEHVGGDPSLNQADGIHPTAEGHKIIATTVWSYLRPKLWS